MVHRVLTFDRLGGIAIEKAYCDQRRHEQCYDDEHDDQFDAPLGTVSLHSSILSDLDTSSLARSGAPMLEHNACDEEENADDDGYRRPRAECRCYPSCHESKKSP